MNQLTKFLVDGILNEGEQKTLAAYGGGFKPPTAGHFEVVKKALKDNPEIDEFIIYVGSGERNGITQAESILIWEVYQTYLPMKVKIEPSKAPIGDVLRLGKNNPQDKVYFVIGAREDNEGDLEDIKNRTRAIGGKHPNMEVKVITTKNEGMSGTNARKAAKVSFENFAKFLPTELSNDEKETVYNIVKPVVKESLNENTTPPQTIIGSKTKLVLVSTNNEVLGLTSRYDVFDKEDSLIGYVEITDRSKGSKLAKDAIQVGNVELNSPNQGYGSSLYLSLINTFSLPIISDPSLSTQGHYLWGSLVKKGYAKTWEDERKRNRYISISEYKSLNENASYSQDIDVKSKIMQLTQHMLDKGYNIEPLPNVELIDGDSVNAREFFGKTAYYDPNSATIVLYTEGRHPKDIVRSFSHEMIHHIQNLEGRLGNITTTNTQEDDHLNDIEAEANLKGTMTFRNWTDSLNENLNDGLYPFKVIDKMYDEGDNSLITVEYEFITPNNSYRVEFYSGEYSPESKTFDLSFGVNTGEFNTIDTFQMTGEGNARKILKTIRNIIEDFIDKEDVEKIIVDGTDEKRKRIYKAIFSKLSNKIEIKEANLKDTTPPRNWTNSLNENILPQEKFAQETNQDYIEQSLKILPNKDKYNLKDYTVEILPIGKVKPTQFGEDYINASSEYEAEQYQKYIDGEIEAEDLRREDFYPIVVDKDTMEILDGNHRHAVHTMLSIPKIKAILVSKKLNEAKKPYKHKHGFDDKLGKDPFGISAYARELASGLEEEIEEGRKKKKDPKKGTGKKPKDSSRRLYTDEDPKDTIGIKFRTKEDIVDTLNKKSFEAKSHARQSQIINLIHQRVRAAYGKAKDPDTKSRLKRGLDYITKRKESSKKKTQRLKNQKNENVAPDHDGKAAPYGSGYKPVNENKTTHKVIAKGIVFEPKNIIINVGDTVEWENKEGYHNVNGKTSNPRNKNNPESFGNKVGSGWTYKFTFTKPGLYKYHCDPHLSADMVGTIQVKENVKEGDTYEKMAAKGKKAGSLKQGTVRKRLGIKKGDKIPLSLINKEIARLRKMDKDPDKKGAQLGDKNQKYYKALQLSKTLKTTTNVNEDAGMIKCSNCGWEWELSNGGDDPYLCHKCGHDNKPNLMEGRYDTITNKLSKIIFEAFKDIHDRGEDKGKISLTIGPDDEDIISNEFEFDLEATVEFVDEDQYEVDGGANVGFDDDGDEVTPLLSVRFKIPKNPKWNIISFDIKDVVRHELEHLTQEGGNLKSDKFMKDDQILRNLIDMELLSKAEYFKLEKEVDAMLQGMYFKAKKSKTPFEKVLNDYLDIFVDQKSISKEEKDDVLNIWRSRRKALSLPPFE